MMKSKICFIVPEFYPHIGGIATATMDFALELKKNSYDVYVVSMTKRREDKKRENYRGIKIYRIYTKNIKPFGGSQFIFILRAHNILKEINPDIIYAQTIFPSGVISAKFKNKITICHGRGTDVTHSLRMKRYYLFNRYALKNNKYVFAKNTEDSKKIMSFYKREVIVLPSGINIPEIKGNKNYWKQKLGLAKNKFHVLYVGREMRFKGINYLKEALKELKDCELHLIGIEKQIPREDVFKWMKACDVFVYPELVGQGLSNAVLEAMSLKMPVIGTNIGFFKELIINEYNGILVRPGNKETIKKAILKVKNNKKLRVKIALNGYLNIKNKHTFKKMLNSFERIINNLG